MKQYALNMIARLPYLPEGFLLHAGIKADFHSCLSLVTNRSGALVFFYAPEAFGKTHLAIKLEEQISKIGRSVKIATAGELAELMLLGASLEHEVYIVDDAHHYLESVKPGDSGPFVTFAEKLKLAGKVLVMLSQKRVDQFDFDHHLASRIKAGSGFSIGVPEQAELAEILRLLATQRGLNLSDRKLASLARNSARSIPGLIQQLEDRDVSCFDPCPASQRST